MSRAVSKSAAAARNANPNIVRCNRRLVATSASTVTPMTTVSKTSMRRKPTA